MSHDLRTPLNSILGFSELLLNSDFSDDTRQDLSIIHRSAEQLNLLINDLLEISSIEAGETKINPGPVDIADLLQEIIRSQQKAAQDKALVLDIEISASLPQWIQTDIKRVRQFIANLVNNAIKYTDQGQIQLKATSLPDILEHERHHLVIEVIDSGRGVPKELHQVIFDPFRQVEETKLHPTEGKGLGLAICKNLVQAMGGKIEIESEPNQGSLFRVTLPVTILKEALRNDGVGLDSLSGHILLVEDDKVNQLILERMLAHIGLTTTKANNGDEALNLLKMDPNKYELILMDCQMPKMDGWKATQLIREQLQLKTPIVALSAYTQNEDVQRSIDSGMNDFLVKPLKLGDLHQKLSKHLTVSLS